MIRKADQEEEGKRLEEVKQRLEEVELRLEEVEKQRHLMAEERLQQVKKMGGGEEEEALRIIFQISFRPICSDVL